MGSVPNYSNYSNYLVSVRRDQMVMQMDLAALVALIQQGGVDATTEVNSIGLTGGTWQRLGELEFFRSLQGTSSEPLASSRRPGSTLVSDSDPEHNLAGYFGSPTVFFLRRDAAVCGIATLLAVVFSALAHRNAVPPLATAGAWLAAYVLADRAVFMRWIAGIRAKGFRRLPWPSRTFMVVAFAVPAYLLIVLFIPEMPGETLLRWVDTILAALLGLASGAVWAFWTGTRRTRRAFERSNSPRPPRTPPDEERD